MTPQPVPILLALAWTAVACRGGDVVEPGAPDPSLEVQVAAPPAWTPTDISPVPGNSYAWKINDNGAIVGWSNTATGTQAWFRTPGGVIRWLPAAPVAIGSEAFGVSNNGHIAGTMLYPGGVTRIAFWLNSTGALPIVSDSLPSPNTNAFAVTNASEVVGWGYAGAQQVAFLWRPVTVPQGLTRLSTLGIQETQAYDITAGWIVGTANDGVHGQVAVRWPLAGGAPQVLSSGEGRAYGVNPNGGRVVGYLAGATSASAALWRTATGTEIIYGPSGGSSPIELRDVTNTGVAAGMALVNGVPTPWVVRNNATAGYRLTLPVPTGQPAQAFSINENCRIVGWGAGTAWLWIPSQCP